MSQILTNSQIPFSSFTREQSRLTEEPFNQVVILPHYGEYGHFLMTHVRVVHQVKARVKVVCCRPGEELLFPSASDFYYEWNSIFVDKERRGLRNEWPVRQMRECSEEERMLSNKLEQKWGTKMVSSYFYSLGS